MTRRRMSRLSTFAAVLTMAWLVVTSQGFLINPHIRQPQQAHAAPPVSEPSAAAAATVGTTTSPRRRSSSSSSSTALSVWWFGGSQSEASSTSEDSCELVAVRIERTSSNSRRILGEIIVPVALEDVWAILTDYDRLSVHVPNLMESKIVQRGRAGEQGDGNYRCRLFQRGAQKIVGFEFGASVTMDMQESITALNAPLTTRPRYNWPEASVGKDASLTPAVNGVVPRERKITFQCVDSMFFSEFDGEWKVQERLSVNTGEPETVLSYVVDVRPKGPVPVAALEWRIREDVPTNLRAVKKASTEVGYEGVVAHRLGQRRRRPPQLAETSSAPRPPTTSQQRKPARRNGTSAGNKQKKGSVVPQTRLGKVRVQWEESETMAAYLKKQ